MARAGLAVDVLIALCLAVVAVTLSMSLSRQLPASLYSAEGNDAWFQADLGRAMRNMVDTRSNHFRTKVHPIASIAIHPVVTALRGVWPASDLQAALRVVWAVGALWAMGFYALCRLLAMGRVAGVCFALLAIGSAAFQFWFSVAETFAFGSLTLLAVLLVAAVAVHRPVRDRWIVLASVLSLSITVTNWVAGLVLALAQRPWRRALRLSAIAFLIVVALTVVQRGIYRFAKFFFLGSREELDYVNVAEAGTWLDKLAGMFWSPMAIPALAIREQLPPDLDWLTVQLSTPGSGSWAGGLALVLWSVLLLSGVYGLVTSQRWRSFAWVLLPTMGAQVLLHMVYGEETFLYAAHFLPLLLAVAVFARHSPLGRLAPTVALVAAGLAAANNHAVFETAVQRLPPSAVSAP